MATAYHTPGVTVTETVNTSFAPTFASPQIVAIVGGASGFQSATERLVLTGTSTTTLGHTGVDTGTIVVKSNTTGVTLNPGNYVIASGTDPDPSVTGDEPTTLARFGTATAPTAANTGTGTLVGTYQYAVSFVNGTGETGIGAVSNSVVLATAAADLTAIAVGPTGTTARNVYRRKTAGSGADNAWHLVATISNNSATTLSDETVSDVTAAANASPPDGIASGDTVIVSYQYTDQYYYKPTILSDLGSIEDKYGTAFDDNGLVNSPLSFSARLALINGASEVMLAAATDDSDVAIENALENLEGEEDIRILVAARGTTGVISALLSHVQQMVSVGKYRFAVAGIDGTSSQADPAAQRTLAQTANYEGLRVINVSSLFLQNPVTFKNLNVGAQYAAAALGGMYAARDVQVTLTRKNLTGFMGINDRRTETEKSLDSGAGLLVIEERGGLIRVRHDITTAVGNVNTREACVSRAKFELAGRLKTTLDDTVIGITVPATQAPTIVESSVVGILEQLVAEQAITSYSDVTARLLTDPTTVEVRFAYVPAYPINNINVIFTIDTSTGDFALVA